MEKTIVSIKRTSKSPHEAVGHYYTISFSDNSSKKNISDDELMQYFYGYRYNEIDINGLIGKEWKQEPYRPDSTPIYVPKDEDLVPTDEFDWFIDESTGNLYSKDQIQRLRMELKAQQISNKYPTNAKVNI